MMRFVLGIDPGCTGAYALLDEQGAIAAMGDLPIVRDGKAIVLLDGQFGFDIMRAAHDHDEDTPTNASIAGVIERIGGRDNRGTSMVKAAAIFGGCCYAMQSNHVPLNFVTPSQWKAHFNLQMPGAKDLARKKASLNKARLLFPTADLDREKDHNRAEALLIAEWFRNVRMGRS